MIQLNYRDSKPIYEQIKDALKKLLIGGAIQADDKLPSVRELATKLAINPNTIQRAYRELEAENYIYTITGKGSFAAAQTEASSVRSAALLVQFDELTNELLYLHVSADTLCKHVHDLAKGEKKND